MERWPAIVFHWAKFLLRIQIASRKQVMLNEFFHGLSYFVQENFVKSPQIVAFPIHPPYFLIQR